MTLFKRDIFLFFFWPLVLSGVTANAQSEDAINAAANATNPLAFVAKVQGEPNFTWKEHGGRQINLASRVIYPHASIGLPFIKSKTPSKIYTVFRLEAPIIGQFFPDKPASDAVGLADLTFVDAVVFRKSWGLFGIGPGLIIPTLNPESISAGKWSAGLSGVYLNTKTKTLSWGVQVQQYFSFAGDRDRSKQNFMLFQPIINKFLGGGKFLSFSSILNFNWEKETCDLPIGVNFGKAFEKNLSLLMGPEYVVSGPNEGDFTFRIQINAMFLSSGQGALEKLQK